MNLQEKLSNMSTEQFCAPFVLNFSINSTKRIFKPIFRRIKANTLEVNLEQVLQSLDEYMIFSKFVYKSHLELNFLMTCMNFRKL
jgi:hypothetical protein